MKKLYIGLTGSGKTTILLKKYREIGLREQTPEDCLVLLKNATSVSTWRTQINLPTMGPAQIFTYFGFIQNELKNYWPWVEERLVGELRTIEPVFMTVETAHYLMSKLVEDARYREGAFATINATAQQIAVQLIDNLNQGAMNQLTFTEMKQRLFAWAGGDPEKLNVYQEALQVIRKFRAQALKMRCLDYSLVINLYDSYLLGNLRYEKDLRGRYRYLIVDDLEKTVPTGQSMILEIMQRVVEAYLSYNPAGGFTRFFGSNPQLAKETFFPRCELVNLDTSYTSSEKAQNLATELAEKIHSGKPLLNTGFIIKDIQKDLRGDMLLAVAEEVLVLLKKGVRPAEIALIAPLVDKVLEFSLDRYLNQRGYSLANLTRNKRLLDEPYAQALVSLAILVNPGWKAQLNFSALSQTLSLILRLDPIRSALIAEETFKDRLNLPDLDELNLRPQLGFDNSDRYDHFKDWVYAKQAADLELEHFFQQVFGELLAPLKPSEKDILACRQIINSVTKFKQVMNRSTQLGQSELAADFVDLVLNGTLAAEVLFRPPVNERQVILATPYTFLLSPFIQNVRYLFWLDVASENWFQSTTKELVNPYVYSKLWQGEEWTDQVDQKLRKEQLGDYLQSLLNKCTDGLYLANSYLSSRGWEQEGQLLEWIQSDQLNSN